MENILVIAYCQCMHNEISLINIFEKKISSLFKYSKQWESSFLLQLSYLISHFQLLECSLWCWVHICFHIIPIYLSPFCLPDSNRASLFPVPHDSTSNIYWQSTCHPCFLQAKLPQVQAVSESMEYGNADDLPFIFKASNTCFWY